MRKLFILIGLLGVLFGAPSQLFAACTHTSTNVWTADTDANSIQTCINSALSGDIVKVAAGTYDVTATLTISGKALTLLGSGSASTTLNIDVGNAVNDGMVITASSTNFVRVSGFTFKTVVAAPVEAHLKITGPSGDTDAVRVDHCVFNDNNIGGTSYRLVHWEKVYGLFDHDTFTRAVCNTQSIEFTGDIGNVGYPDWQRPYTPGTNKSQYLEDSTFTHTCFGETAMDQYSSRAVFRYNTVNGSATGDHGLDSGGRRSKFSTELYRNTFTNNLSSAYKADDNRGGVNLMFDNTYGGTGGGGTPYSPYATHYARATNSYTVDPGMTGWQYCDGTNYDVVADGHASATANTASRFKLSDVETLCSGAFAGDCERYLDGSGTVTHGYPCRDQPGFTHGQVLEGTYQWNNLQQWNNQMIQYSITEGGCDGQAANCSPLWNSGIHINYFIQPNREIYDGKTGIQLTASSPFDGTTGVGWGPLLKMPGTCTNGTAYFATDQGTWNKKSGGSQGVLYRCTSGTFQVYYTPYTYPNPLQSSAPTLSDCTLANVQAAINALNAGDAVACPAGSWTWTSTLSINKAVTLLGAGIGQTNITLSPPVSSTLAISLTVDPSQFVRLSGFTFTAGNNNASVDLVQVVGFNQYAVSGMAFRIDHVRMNDGNIASARLLGVYYAYGLIDHCYFKRNLFGQSVEILGGSNNSDLGYTSWTQPLSLGSGTDAVYLEDSTIDHDNQGETGIDQYGGVRSVVRYNTIIGTGLGDHGLDSGGRRSAFSMESYRNTFTNSGSTSVRADTIRGGTQVQFDNTYSGSQGFTGIAVLYYRTVFSSDFHGWAYCDGTQYDVVNALNTTTTYGTATRFLSTAPDTICTGAATGTCTQALDLGGTGTFGYPCRDQPGRTHNQALAPLYQWNNGSQQYAPLDPDPGTPTEQSPLYQAGHRAAEWLGVNRDFYNGASGVQTSASSPFNGTTGVGWGTLARRPSSCTTGVGYFATDQGSWNMSGNNDPSGILYVCSAPNTWTTYYTPYTYPHPLQGIVTQVVSNPPPPTVAPPGMRGILRRLNAEPAQKP